MQHEVTAGFGTADRMQNLGARTGRLCDYIQPFEAPMRGHLAATGTRVLSGSDCAEQHFVWRRSQGQA